MQSPAFMVFRTGPEMLRGDARLWFYLGNPSTVAKNRARDLSLLQFVADRAKGMRTASKDRT